MSASGAVVSLNRPPERFDDRIHESVSSIDAEDGLIDVRVTVVGGLGGEGVSLHMSGAALNSTTELTPEAAIRIGQLLVAAGRESLGLGG